MAKPLTFVTNHGTVGTHLKPRASTTKGCNMLLLLLLLRRRWPHEDNSYVFALIKIRQLDVWDRHFF